MAAAIVAAKKRRNPIAVAPEEPFKLEFDPKQTLPPISELLLDAVLEKKTLSANGTSWVKKRVVLCHDKLAICGEGSERVSEYIPLLEITEVKKLYSEQSSNLISSTQKDATGSNSLRSVIGKKGKDVDSNGCFDSNLIPKFEISTISDGHNGGRRFIFRCDVEKDRDNWVKEVSAEVRREIDRQAAYERSQRRFSLKRFLRTIHYSSAYASILAFLILLMFINAIAIAELPDGPRRDTLLWVDAGFTIAFTVELLINMGALWFREFWVGEEWAWNCFDFVLISVSLPLIFVTNSSVTVLRLIAKLFHRVQSLNKIISALTSSLLPVANAFVILFVISCIYAIIGTELFGHKNEEQFGDFTSALFTMFQVMTGDAWSTDVARPLFDVDTHPTPEVAIFFVSYFVLAGIFVLNVVIAVLLDAFLEQLEADKGKERLAEQQAILDETIRRGTSIDPLLLSLSAFSSIEDLNDKIHDIFKALDGSRNGFVSFEEMAHGLSKLNVEPKIKFSEENFEIITENRKKCVGANKDALDEATFKGIIVTRLKQFMKRYIGERMVPVCRDDMKTETILFMLKTLILDEQLEADEDDREETAKNRKLNAIEKRVMNLEGGMASISDKLDQLLRDRVRGDQAPKKKTTARLLDMDSDDEI